MIAGGEFYLGGYGLSNGTIAGEVSYMEGRKATGILRDGVHSRALAVSDGTRALVTAQIEAQGVYAAYKTGPFGIEDIRRDAAAAATAARPGGPTLGAGQIVVDSNHTHAGPDTAGVWGGVPQEYLQLVHDRTVAAIVRAYTAMVPATLSFGTAKGGVGGIDADALINNQFSNDPANQAVDDELRVLRAVDRRGKVIVTYLNFSAHPTVLGGSNTLVSGDYTGPLSTLLAGAGGVGFAQVGTLGRTQPARGGCPDKALKDAAASACALDEYAGRVFARAEAGRRGSHAADRARGGGPAQLSHPGPHHQRADLRAVQRRVRRRAPRSCARRPRRGSPAPWSAPRPSPAASATCCCPARRGEPYPQIPLAVRDATPSMRGPPLARHRRRLPGLPHRAGARGLPRADPTLRAVRRAAAHGGRTARVCRRRSAARAPSTTTPTSSTRP